jgi:hypothetical protein
MMSNKPKKNAQELSVPVTEADKPRPELEEHA